MQQGSTITKEDFTAALILLMDGDRAFLDYWITVPAEDRRAVRHQVLRRPNTSGVDLVILAVLRERGMYPKS